MGRYFYKKPLSNHKTDSVVLFDKINEYFCLLNYCSTDRDHQSKILDSMLYLFTSDIFVSFCQENKMCKFTYVTGYRKKKHVLEQNKYQYIVLIFVKVTREEFHLNSLQYVVCQAKFNTALTHFIQGYF